MRPIDFRVDLQFVQALKCVEYRVPRHAHFHRPGYAVVLGLRYGLIGIAATYHLLETSASDDTTSILEAMKSWQRLVGDHVRYELFDRLPFGQDETFHHEVSRYAEYCHQLSIPLLLRRANLNDCLNIVSHQVRNELVEIIRAHWDSDLYGIPDSEFLQFAQQSEAFAKNFYERRVVDLPELPEIALLDE